MTTLRATTALAADIAGIDRQRFNEACNAGFYPCAPETVAGRARSFGLNDLLALKVYGHLIAEGVTPRFAGKAACGLLHFLQECPEADHALHVVSQMRVASWVRPETFNSADTSRLEIVSVRDWYLKPMREQIVARLDEESRTVGPVGEEA